MSGTNPVSPLRQRMIEDMAARKLDPHTQRSHISSCRRFAAWLDRSPETAAAEEVRRFQLHLVESGAVHVPDLGPPIVAAQRDAEQEAHPGHDPIAVADAWSRRSCRRC